MSAEGQDVDRTAQRATGFGIITYDNCNNFATAFYGSNLHILFLSETTTITV